MPVIDEHNLEPVIVQFHSYRLRQIRRVKQLLRHHEPLVCELFPPLATVHKLPQEISQIRGVVIPTITRHHRHHFRRHLLQLLLVRNHPFIRVSRLLRSYQSLSLIPDA